MRWAAFVGSLAGVFARSIVGSLRAIEPTVLLVVLTAVSLLDSPMWTLYNRKKLKCTGLRPWIISFSKPNYFFDHKSHAICWGVYKSDYWSALASKKFLIFLLIFASHIFKAWGPSVQRPSHNTVWPNLKQSLLSNWSHLKLQLCNRFFNKLANMITVFMKASQ
jgi:hypothetical protein